MAVVGAACGAAGACVSEERRAGDVVDSDVSAALRCTRDEECDKFTNVCNTSSCVDGACRSEPIVCDDANVCTNDSCDVTRGGCIFKARDAGIDCVVGFSGACDGDAWHEPDRCDDSGHCVDGGARACREVVTGDACRHGTCEPARGCVIANDEDGSSCTRDGRSDVCLDGVHHLADACRGGTCVDGGTAACTAGFCEAPACDGRSCAVTPLGVDVDLTGEWVFFELAETTLELESRQARLQLGGNGTIAVGTQRSPARGQRFTGGAYCVGTDGRVQLQLAGGDVTREYRGRVTRGRQVAVLTPSDGSDGLVMMVKDDAGASHLSGSYRLLGVEKQRIAGQVSNHTMLGTVAFADGCLTGGNYTIALGEEGYQLSAAADAGCALGSMGDGRVELSVTSNAEART